MLPFSIVEKAQQQQRSDWADRLCVRLCDVVKKKRNKALKPRRGQDGQEA